MHWLEIISQIYFISGLILSSVSKKGLKIWIRIVNYIRPLRILLSLKYFIQQLSYVLSKMIYSAIRRGFPSLEWVQIIESVLCNFAVIRVLPFLNKPKDLDPSYKTDLDFWDCFGRKKTPSYKRRNTVSFQFSSLFGAPADETWILYKHTYKKTPPPWTRKRRKYTFSEKLKLHSD